MTSAGGLVGRQAFHAKDSLLSGPAGGIVGARAAGREAGYERIIAFDMGGTSTDVARCDGDFEYIFEHRVGDAHLVAPALAIESVAAGGGSVCVADRHGLRVGPESAGASPGPACYGAGGPLTLTDVNLLLGRLLPDRFEIPLVRERAEEAANTLLTDLERETGERQERDTVMEGLLEIANERMADAIRRVSLRRGYDPAEYALVSFGGAGGQHACAVASRLGIRTVLVPRDASLLSALGIGRAAIERFAERQVLRPLGDITDEGIASLLDELAQEATTVVSIEGVTPDGVTIRRRIVALRLAGQESTLTVDFDPAMPLAEAFAERYAAVYGHRPPTERTVEVESVRAVAGSGAEGRPHPPTPSPNAGRGGGNKREIGARFEGAWVEAAVYEREEIRAEETVTGPSLIVERHSVVVVEPGWAARVDVNSGALVLAQTPSTGTPSPRIGEGGRGVRAAEPVQEELFTGRFAAIAEEMGEMLQRTALSTNVKERLDFSCALLGPGGDLVASAAHIPVHLGALGACVRSLRGAIPMVPGDVIVTNHPGFGGSHLPDVTVVTPVFGTGDRLLGYVASRAHHAEIGGSRPGSMPPDATTLAEEGVVIPPTYLVRAGEAQLDSLAGGLYPSRAVDDNLADLEAALAANRRGAQALAALAERYGTETLWHFMDALTGRAERLLRRALAAMPEGRYEATEYLDDGSPLAVAVTIRGDAAVIDFAGTAATHPGNLNAPPAVAASAVLYVLRLLVGEPLPLNEGLLRPITLRLPENSLVNPPFDLTDPMRCPAVVGGNTEVSQRVVDTLLKALGLAACSQGTMNNVLWGTETFGYYETVCGGAGATANAPGAHAVHTHMTNTRITDPEIIERRYPVCIERFAVRRGSGGAGCHPGGDGAVRETTFLAPMALSVLTQHRTTSPYGLAGGEPGQLGRQTLLRASGETVELHSTDGADVQPSDRLLLETPGGGGWGKPPEK
jgi:5-oxoprolinase (ATP-hydrolysing)